MSNPGTSTKLVNHPLHTNTKEFFHICLSFFPQNFHSDPDEQNLSNFKFRNINDIEKKLTRFQNYPEIELACKYTKPIYKTQYSEILVEYEQGFDINTGKLIIPPMATHRSTTDEISFIPVNLLKTQEEPPTKDSTRLKELSLLNNTYVGSINYVIHLDMKLDYTLSRIFLH